MNLEKFTERSRGFIQAAQTIAMRESHQRLAPEHILKALMDDDQGLREGDSEHGHDPHPEPLQPEQTDDNQPMGEKRTYEEDEREDEPVSKRSRLEYLEVFELKVANLLKAKQNKEIRFQELSQNNKECFKRAMKKEIDNNFTIGAYE